MSWCGGGDYMTNLIMSAYEVHTKSVNGTGLSNDSIYPHSSPVWVTC